MSKNGKNKRRGYRGSKSRDELMERQQKKEILAANRGDVEEPYNEAVPEMFPVGDAIDDLYEKMDESPKNDAPQKWYVLDTNLILSCVDVLYDPDDENWREPLNFRPYLGNAHLIIPEVVYDELDHINKGKSALRVVARIAIARLEKFFANSSSSMDNLMNLKCPVPTGWKNQTISKLPLHRDFEKCLPWVPPEDDHDGWIAVTALAASMIRRGHKVDGSEPIHRMMNRTAHDDDAILLSQDKHMRGKAQKYTVKAQTYSFKKRRPYTGCRELTVPVEMFNRFYYEEQLSGADFEKYFPKEPRLVANEYIIMKPEGDEYPRPYFMANIPFANIARYHKENGMLYPLRFMKYEGREPLNAGIATYYDALNDDKIHVICVTGRAGVGKTYQAVHHAIDAVMHGKYNRIVGIVSTTGENPLGALKGTEKDKMEPLVRFCKDAIRAYLEKKPEFREKRNQMRRRGFSEFDIEVDDGYYSESSQKKSKKAKKKEKDSKDYYPSKDEKKNLENTKVVRMSYNKWVEGEVDKIFDNFFEFYLYEQIAGRNFPDSFIFIDEIQRMKIDETFTSITRLAEGSKLVVCGDVAQNLDNSPEKKMRNGLSFTRLLYYDWEGCANIHLTENMRHDVADVANRNYTRALYEMGLI